MRFSTGRLIPTVLLIAALGNAAIAQTGGEVTPPKVGGDAGQGVDPGRRPRPGQNRQLGGVDGFPPAEPAERAPRRINRYFQVGVYSRPRRLAPGQRGELQVVVLLSREGRAVVVPSAFYAIRFADVGEGPFVYGKPQLDPPTARADSPWYQGERVYDDTVVFRVPVTVRPEAEPQQYQVKGDIDLQLHTAADFRPIQRVWNEFFGNVAIGKPLPDPVVGTPSNTDETTVERPRDGAATPTGTPSPGTSPGVVGTEVEAAGAGAGRLDPQPRSAPESSTDLRTGTPTGLPNPAAGSSLTMMLLGGAILVLLLGSLLIFRRR